jgi:hypothetical protein
MIIYFVIQCVEKTRRREINQPNERLSQEKYESRKEKKSE